MTKPKHVRRSTTVVLVATMALAAGISLEARAQDHGGRAISFQAADPNEQGDGTIGPAAAAALARGPLPFGPDAVAAKAAANRAYAAAARSGALRPARPADLVAAGQPTAKAPIVVGGLNFDGIAGGASSTNTTPPDTEGAIGTTRYIQIVNSAVGIYNRSNGAVIAGGRLNQLAQNASSVNSFDPQVIWDPTTSRFYYVMDSIFSSTDNRLAFGFSKTASPSNVTTDWCHYYVKYGTPFPDYPKLGDSRFFIIIGVNVFANNSTGGFVGSDIVAVGKPPNGNITTCPAASTMKKAVKADLRDTSNNRVFTPVPSNQIDTNGTGYVVTTAGGSPATRLWFFNVTINPSNGAPVFGNARGVTVSGYSPPPNASQPTFTQVLDTLDARITQAIQGINPARGTIHSFWTQHTIASSSVSGVRWYEINPAPATPVVMRTGTITAANTFLFNAAISSDRRVKGSTKQFGDSFVIQYNASSSVNSISPRIIAASSFRGRAVSGAVLIKGGVGPYRDFSCPDPGDICRWGDYAAATPDPQPATTDRGVVWGTNQYSGVVNPPASTSNWRTQIFAVKP